MTISFVEGRLILWSSFNIQYVSKVNELKHGSSHWLFNAIGAAGIECTKRGMDRSRVWYLWPEAWKVQPIPASSPSVHVEPVMSRQARLPGPRVD